MKNLKELKEERAALQSQMMAIPDKAKQEGRNVTVDEAKLVNTLYDQDAELRDQIKAEERAAEIRAEISSKVEETAEKNGKSNDEQRAELNSAFKNIILRRASQKDFDTIRSFEKRATEQSTTAAEGGYTIPTGFLAEIQKTMLYYGPMLDTNLVRIINTPSGNDIHIPTNNDTTVKATKISEGAAVGTGTAPVWGEKVLKAYKYSTGIVKYTPELLADSAFDFSQVLSDLFGERMGRGLNYAFTKGAGTTDVQGVVTGASSGITSASETAITQSELLSLIHSLDVAYRNNGKLMMNDSTLKAIINLAISTAATQSNLYMPGTSIGDNGMVLNYPILINNDMDAIGAGLVPIVFGDFKQYMQRYIGAPTFKTLFELYASTDELAAIMFRRVDGQVMQTTAFKKLTMINT